MNFSNEASKNELLPIYWSELKNSNENDSIISIKLGIVTVSISWTEKINES